MCSLESHKCTVLAHVTKLFFHFITFMKTDTLSHQHLSHLSSKPNFQKVSVLPSHEPSLLFPFHLLSYPTHPTVFSFYIFPGFLAISILLTSNNINSQHPTGFFFYVFPGFLASFILSLSNNKHNDHDVRCRWKHIGCSCILDSRVCVEFQL